MAIKIIRIYLNNLKEIIKQSKQKLKQINSRQLTQSYNIILWFLTLLHYYLHSGFPHVWPQNIVGEKTFCICACCGLALTTIMFFSFSWSQSCRSPTCLCSRTLCMSWTSLMVLFLQRQQMPLLTQGLPQSLVNSSTIKSSIYLSGLASMCKVLRKSTRVKVSKCLKENILTKTNPVKLWLEKVFDSIKTLTSDYCSILTLFSNRVWRTKRQTVEDFVEKEWYWYGKEVGWSTFRVRKVLSFIAPLTPPHPHPLLINEPPSLLMLLSLFQCIDGDGYLHDTNAHY